MRSINPYSTALAFAAALGVSDGLWVLATTFGWIEGALSAVILIQLFKWAIGAEHLSPFLWGVLAICVPIGAYISGLVFAWTWNTVSRLAGKAPTPERPRGAAQTDTLAVSPSDDTPPAPPPAAGESRQGAA